MPGELTSKVKLFEIGSSTSSTADKARESVAQSSTSIGRPSDGSIMICRMPPPRLIDTRTRSKPMPTMVGATISSIRCSKSSVTKANSVVLGTQGAEKRKRAGSGPLFFLWLVPCEPDEDGADISALLLAGKGFLASLNDARKPPAPPQKS